MGSPALSLRGEGPSAVGGTDYLLLALLPPTMTASRSVPVEPVSISVACGLVGALWGIRFGRRSCPVDPPLKPEADHAKHPTLPARSQDASSDEPAPSEMATVGAAPDDLDARFSEFLAADPHEQPARRWLLGA